MEDNHILVVDDEENILELVKYNLSQEGYEVSLAANGEEALKKVEDIVPDLITLDIMLPGLDGFEVCRCLQEKEKTEGIPIIFLSAKSGVGDKVKGLDLGVTDYLTNKEFNLLAYLIDKLGKVCSRDELLANIWGYENVSGIRTIDVHIRMLRKKFTQYNMESLSIKTVQGVNNSFFVNINLTLL